MKKLSIVNIKTLSSELLPLQKFFSFPNFKF